MCKIVKFAFVQRQKLCTGIWCILSLLSLTQNVLSGTSAEFQEELETNLVDIEERGDGLQHDKLTIETDDIFKELVSSKPQFKLQANANFSLSDNVALYNDFWRDKRGALHLAEIIKCATNCNPLSYKGYGCYCGFLGSGEPVDGIDTCCKMHDWCYTTTTCMGIDWHLPYFVPFKWKCNGGAPYCIPGKTKKSDRNSCSHQLCECDREFAMCLQKYLPCPSTKAMCKSKQRLWQNVLMGFGSGNGVHNPYNKHQHHSHKSHKHHHHNSNFRGPVSNSERYSSGFQHQDIHGEQHRFKPPPLIDLPSPVYPFKGLRFRVNGK